VSGDRVGEEPLVNTTTDSNQMVRSVASLEGGGFVISWQSADQNSNGFDAYSKVFNMVDGSVTSSDEILINQSQGGDQTLPMVAGLSDGGYVSSWISADGDSKQIVLQRFDSAGGRIGVEVVVDQLASELEGYAFRSPEVSGLNDGGFVTVWTNADSDSSGVFFQRFDANGDAVGEITLINGDESSIQYNAHVTELNDGGFMTTWVNVSEDNSSMEVMGQKFDASGESVGDTFKVSDITQDSDVVKDLLDLDEPDVAVDLNDLQLDFDNVATDTMENNNENIAKLDTLDLKDMMTITTQAQDEIKMDLLDNMPSENSNQNVANDNVPQVSAELAPEMDTNHESQNITFDEHIVDVDQY
jgi:hypothetical protein